MQTATDTAPIRSSSLTPELDFIRPRVLAALHAHGWACEPAQYGRRFRVRARLRTGEDPKTGTPRHVLAVLEFEEDGTGVTYTTSGGGVHQALADLRREGVLS